jgi:membrane protease YdiL (CAAX protease family)
LIALASRQWEGAVATVGNASPWLAAFAALTLAVASLARWGERLGPRDVGFRGVGWLTAPLAIVLALFFVFVFGPAAYWALSRLPLGSFGGGGAVLSGLPAWFLALDIVIVAASEEWLYRGYAIERLQALTGRPWLAGLISLAVFGMVHLPLWGPGVALSTLVSGGVLTGLYLWRRDVLFLILAHVATDLYGLVLAPGRR